MKRLANIAVLSLLFLSAFAGGKQTAINIKTPPPDLPDTTSSVWLYTEAIKQNVIYRDSKKEQEFLLAAIAADSTYAPAYYQMAASGLYSSAGEGVELARRAYRLDTTNKWYRQFLGQILIYARHYGEAVDIFRTLCAAEPQNPDNYRLLAALYEEVGQPYSALATLDSAEVRFGRIAELGAMKRQLLISTHQLDKAVAEATALIDAVPYEAQNYVVLANIYTVQKQDSLAQATYEQAFRIDSTNVETLSALVAYYSENRNYSAMFDITRRLFTSEEIALNAKIRNFEQLTADSRFYREYYTQLNSLAAILAVRYPQNQRVVELYARHLIASGELEQALAFYKSHLDDNPPVESYYRTVIDIESYLQRPDSVDIYVGKALETFPNQADFHLAKGNALSYSKKYDPAIKKYKESLKYVGSDSLRSVVWGLIGDAHHQKAITANGGDDENWNKKARSQMKQSYKAYEKSLLYNPDNVMVLNNYAYFLSLEERDLERAHAMASRVVALTDNNPTYLDTYGWVLFKMGRLDEARKVIQQAVALDGQNSTELLVHYGDILNALGERFMAETYWRKALEKGYNAGRIEMRLKQKKL